MKKTLLKSIKTKLSEKARNIFGNYTSERERERERGRERVRNVMETMEKHEK